MSTARVIYCLIGILGLIGCNEGVQSDLRDADVPTKSDDGDGPLWDHSNQLAIAAPVLQTLNFKIPAPSELQAGAQVQAMGYPFEVKYLAKFDNWNGRATEGIADDLDEVWLQSTSGEWLFVTPTGYVYLWQGEGPKLSSASELGRFIGFLPQGQLNQLKSSKTKTAINVLASDLLSEPGNRFYEVHSGLKYAPKQDNWFGAKTASKDNDLNEKWFSAGDDWYFLLPSGQLYKYSNEKRGAQNHEMLAAKAPLGFAPAYAYSEPERFAAVSDVMTLTKNGKPAAAQFDYEAPLHTLYMTTEGSDSNDGLDPSRPMATLAGIHNRLRAMRVKNGAVHIKVASGVYQDQSVIWKTTVPGHQIVIQASDPENPPVFDGAGLTLANSAATFFWLQSSIGASRIVLDSLVVRNYQWGVSFEGEKHNYEAHNGLNIVHNCRFERIGNWHFPDKRYSTYALSLNNSHGNIIANNIFIDVRNKTRSSYLHTLYAISSHFNLVVGNRLLNSNGSPFHFRDFANNNFMTDNLLHRSGYQPYTEWYCHEDRKVECSKGDVLECASWANVLGHTQIGIAYHDKPYLAPRLAYGDTHKDCRQPKDVKHRYLLGQ